ncbi:hypothetical protein LTR56_025324 [Elasticomyces elasticus]|nr:hypothetical protein LTR56_025324 [Elasticomyces elasticus]KAK3621238.1 hypothetical protein LTR22_025283 [Elasticomyces elasticus]KAK4906287.1 hypothetical protein LTR49_024540 [Elasticomyces elasticus]KAK5745862.1 hypothetical protein LTS12_022926 [Elasticomyces elasticus]
MAYPYFSNNQRKQLIWHNLRTPFYYAPIQKTQAEEFGWVRFYAPAVLALSNLEKYFAEISFASTLGILTQRKADSTALAEALFRTAFPADQAVIGKDGIALLRGKQVFARLHDYRKYYPDNVPEFWPLVGIDGKRTALLDKEQTAQGSAYDLHLIHTQNRAFINNDSAPVEPNHFETDDLIENHFRDAVDQVKTGKTSSKHKPIYDWRGHINRSLAKFDELAYDGFSTSIHVDPDWTKFSKIRQDYLVNLRSIEQLREIGFIQGNETVEDAAFVIKSRLQYFNGRYVQHLDADDYLNDEQFLAIITEYATTQWQVTNHNSEDSNAEPTHEQLQEAVNKLNVRKRELALQRYVFEKYATNEDKARQLFDTISGGRLRREFHFCSLSTPIDLTPTDAAVELSVFRNFNTKVLPQQEELRIISRCEVYALDNKGILLPRIQLERLIQADCKTNTGRSTLDQLAEALDQITSALTGGRYATLTDLHQADHFQHEARVWGIAIRSLIVHPDFEDDQTVHTAPPGAPPGSGGPTHQNEDDMGGAKPAKYGQYGEWDENKPRETLNEPTHEKSQAVDLSSTGNDTFLEYKAMHKRFTPKDLPPQGAILSDADAYDLLYLAHVDKKIPSSLLGEMWKATFTAEGYPYRHRKQLGMPAIVWSPRLGRYTYPCIYGSYTLYGGGHFLKLFGSRQDVLDDVSDNAGVREWQRPGANPTSDPPMQQSYSKAKTAGAKFIQSDGSMDVDLNVILWPTHFDHQRTSKAWIEHLAAIGPNLPPVPARLFTQRSRLHEAQDDEDMGDSDYETESAYPSAIHRSYFPIRAEDIGKVHATSVKPPRSMGPPATRSVEDATTGQRMGKPRGLNSDGSTNTGFKGLRVTNSTIAANHSVGGNIAGVPLFGSTPEMQTAAGVRKTSGGLGLFGHQGATQGLFQPPGQNLRGQQARSQSANPFGQRSPGQNTMKLFGQQLGQDASQLSPSSTPAPKKLFNFSAPTSPSAQQQSPFRQNAQQSPFGENVAFGGLGQNQSVPQPMVPGVDAARQAEGQAMDLVHLSQMTARALENMSYQQFLAAHARTSEINMLADWSRRLKAERDLNEGNMHALWQTGMAARNYGRRAGEAIAGAVYAGAPVNLRNLQGLTATQIQGISSASINDYNDDLRDDWLASVALQSHELQGEYDTLPATVYTNVSNRTRNPAATDEELNRLDGHLINMFDDQTRPTSYDRGHLLAQAYPAYWRGVPQPGGNNDLAHGVTYSVPHVSPLVSPKTDRSSSLKRKARESDVLDDDDDEDDDTDITDAIPAKTTKRKPKTATGGTTSPGGTRKKATPRKSGRLNKPQDLGPLITPGPVRIDSEAPAQPPPPRPNKRKNGKKGKDKGKGNAEVDL